MNTMTMMDAETRFRATRTVPPFVLQNNFIGRPRTIGQAVQAAVDVIEDEALKPLSTSATRPFTQSRAVLALLARCYAQQIYNSTQAASVAAHDPDFPWLWWEALPDALALRRFRVENREAVHRCLEAALHFLVEQKISAGVLTKVDGPQIAKEAGRRIIMAAFADSMELDGE